jgi:hypothetical protein
MRRFLRPSAIYGVLLVSAAIHGPAEANCSLNGRHFSTVNPVQYGGDSRIYTMTDEYDYPYLFPDGRSVTDDALGYFWSLGYGSPDTQDSPTIDDNDCGIQRNRLTGDSDWCGSPLNADGAGLWWHIDPEGGGASFIGGNNSNWGSSPDGCIDWDGLAPPGDHRSTGDQDEHQCMLVLLADNPDGTQGRFVLLAVKPDVVGWYHLNKAVYEANGQTPNAAIIMAEVPQPQIIHAALSPILGATVEIDVAEPSGIQDGVHEWCPGKIPNDPVVRGYKIYTQVKNLGDPAPVGRDVLLTDLAWMPRTAESVGPFDEAQFGGPHYFEVPDCDVDKTLYVCVTLVFDSGYETPYCSAQVSRECPNCDDDGECDDGVACTTDTCDPTDKLCVFPPDHGFCGNGVACDGIEYCDTQTGCQPGTPVTCGSVECGTNDCVEPGGNCVITDDDADCDNNLYCDGEETCSGGSCQAGTPVTCSTDGIACTIDACNETLDTCHTPNDSRCTDGLYCTVEWCDAVDGCRYDSTPCAAGEACDESTDQCIGSPGAAAGAVPDGKVVPGSVLPIAKGTGSQISLDWGASCLGGDSDYAIYEGQIGSYYSHQQILCTDGGEALTEDFTPSTTSSYYLVVPLSADNEGSFGPNSHGRERPPGSAVCLPKYVAACP